MAVAEIIGSAIGTMLLIVVAYLLVGSVLNTAEVVTNAQRDITLLQSAMLNTDIQIAYEGIDGQPLNPALNFTVTNTGNQVISDFDHATIFSYTTADPGYKPYVFKKVNTLSDGTWTVVRIEKDYVHPNQLDPGETMWVLAYYTPGATNPVWFEFCTNNGVYASTVI